ncbi:carboxymuconolactone decarboxylase family protein [Bosea sp. (in: a-proteobacteria)]|uniref:(R)-mandelonitrile lyase n=1 Tax=Bosea sp. (in: a-proteobacteria) TaxID=1871050 RepID=UPI00122700EB|nr:carboxymuconolactone decarboxylase family protein [Bosea sp. (in: a-proteobacteria)]TAJ26644.1 MAG: cupin domain-containing protein [Bosea sp. (in: a-proteobacteria)]
MKIASATAAALAMAVPVEAQDRPSVAPKNMQAIAPALAGYTDRVLFGDVWVRPELAPRDRSIVTLSVLIATGKTVQMAGHLGRGLDNGIKPSEVAGMVTQLAFYTGWPNAVSTLNEVEKVFAARHVDLKSLAAIPPATAPLPSSDSSRAATVEKTLVPIAPKYAQLTNEVVFADLWRRTDLSPRDRSLVTIAALSAGGDGDQLAFHIQRGLENGLTQAQIVEALTHLAFYAGWPKANAAIGVAGKVFARKEVAAMSDLQVIHPGQEPKPGPADYFTGSVTVVSPFKSTGDARLGGATVTFQPGAHTNWHTHPLGQLLIVTDGQGWVQVDGEAAKPIATGDTIFISPGVKHWHGAARDSVLTHVAVSEALDGTSVTWLEQVADELYNTL